VITDSESLRSIENGGRKWAEVEISEIPAEHFSSSSDNMSEPLKVTGDIGGDNTPEIVASCGDGIAVRFEAGLSLIMSSDSSLNFRLFT